ncbi:MAG: HD-GYP domain-containing protein (c-di-GMP phosphodiesterase class II) [Flavobacteriales bacterium]
MRKKSLKDNSIVGIDLDASVSSAIQETERYYREQIFSSGCSSLVPIYRVGNNVQSPDGLLKQLQGSPYIQKNIEFAEKVIETLLDVDIYCFKDWHFFFKGTMQAEIADFIEKHCVQVESFSRVVKPEISSEKPKWSKIDEGLSLLMTRYPVLTSLDCNALVQQVASIVEGINFEDGIESYLDIFHKPKWSQKLVHNQSSLLCMVATANALKWDAGKVKTLVMLGVLKDIGYSRLNEHIADFEVMHPLVSLKLLTECNETTTNEDKLLSQDLLDAVLMHHEFGDGSGPLARMRHPLVRKLLGEKMPLTSQISGLCDLYFGFLEKYSPGVAFSITCGFVLGQGDLQPRYDVEVITAFMSALKTGSYGQVKIPDEEAEALVKSILNVLKEPDLRKKATAMILGKSNSWYERITLALNIVRNIAKNQPNQMGEASLVSALYLPQEFGLNY